MNYEEDIIFHHTGLFEFISWIEKRKRLGSNFKILNDIVFFPKDVSSFFGIAKHHRIKKPFLVVQQSSRKWMENIKWQEAVVCLESQSLVIISQIVSGNNYNFPDCFRLAISIEFDLIEKFQTIYKLKRIEARSVSFQGGDIKPNRHSTLFDIPLSIVNYKKDIFSIMNKSKPSTLTSILTKMTQNLEGKYGDTTPTFLGESNLSSNDKHLYEKIYKGVYDDPLTKELIDFGNDIITSMNDKEK